MPPTRKRLFLGAIDVGKQLTAADRRRTVALTTFGHLKLPDNTMRFPDPYIGALMRGVRGVIDAKAVRMFNSDQAAKEALKTANASLHARLNEWLAESTQPGYLSVTALTWVLGADRARITRWHTNSLVASKLVDGRIYIQVADLLSKCRWVLPKE